MVTLAVAAALTLLGAGAASAATFTWIGGSGQWNVSGNWSGPTSAVPGVNDTANVSTGAPNVTSNASVGRLGRTGADMVINAGVTLTAAGTALANDGVTTVTGNTLSGGGTIHGGGALTLNGQTTIGSVAMCDSSAASGVTLTLNDQTGVTDSTFISAGTLGLGRGAKLENTGQLTLFAGSAISASQDAVYTVHNAPGGNLFQEGSAASIANFDNDGVFHVNQNGFTITGNNPSPPSSGDWVLAAATTMSLAVGSDSWAGNVSGPGKLVLNGVGSVSMTSASSFAPGAVEINGGTLTLGTAATTIAGPTLKIDAGGTLNIAAGHTYSPPSATIISGSLGGAGTLVLNNQSLGSLNISAATLKLSGATFWGTGTINVGNGATVLNTGTLNATGTAALGGLNDSVGTLTNQTGATLSASSTASLTHVVNAGTLTISSGTPGIQGVQSAGGLTVVSPATTLAQAGGPYTLNGGILRGFGTVAADLVNTGGTVAPGGSVGVLTLTGNYTQGAGGRLEEEISGTTLGSGYDHLQVGGDATLDGTLAILNDPLFDPQVGQTFTVVSTSPGNVHGTFAQLTGDTVGAKRYSASYLPATPPQKNVVLGLSLSPPTNTTPPLVSPPSAHPGETLACSDGTWSGATSFTYAWRRDGTDIAGASSAQYVVQTGDVGHTLDCRVTAANTAGPTSQLSSNSVTPTAVPVTPPPPAATAPPKATPASTEPATIKASQVITLPSTKACVSRRSFRIRLRAPSGVTIASAAVFVNGKRVDVVKGKRLSAPVDLKGLPKGRFSVKITVTTATGRKVTDTRRYRTCAPKRR